MECNDSSRANSSWRLLLQAPQNCIVAEPPRACEEDEEPHFNVTLPAAKRSTQSLSVFNILYEVQNDTFTFLLDLQDPSKFGKQ